MRRNAILITYNLQYPNQEICKEVITERLHTSVAKDGCVVAISCSNHCYLRSNAGFVS